MLNTEILFSNAFCTVNNAAFPNEVAMVSPTTNIKRNLVTKLGQLLATSLKGSSYHGEKEHILQAYAGRLQLRLVTK